MRYDFQLQIYGFKNILVSTSTGIFNRFYKLYFYFYNILLLKCHTIRYAIKFNTRDDFVGNICFLFNNFLNNSNNFLVCFLKTY